MGTMIRINDVIISYLPLEGGGWKIYKDNMINGLVARLPKNTRGDVNPSGKTDS